MPFQNKLQIADAIGSPFRFFNVQSAIPGIHYRLQAGVSLCSFQPFDLFGKSRHDFEQIPDNTVCGHLEDRCIRILVDGHDEPGGRHARQMLDGARDTAGDIEGR